MSKGTKKRNFKKQQIKFTTMKKLILSVFALSAFVFGANAVNTLNGDGKAVLTDAITLAEGTASTGFAPGELNFGTIAIGSVSTTFVINPETGAFTAPTAAGSAFSTSSDQTAAAYVVDGTDGQDFVVVVGTPVASAAQGTSLTLTTSAARTIVTGGTDLNVGGSLVVPANSTTGAVAYTFDLTVNYQ